jgi:hypothetical protein
MFAESDLGDRSDARVPLLIGHFDEASVLIYFIADGNLSPAPKISGIFAEIMGQVSLILQAAVLQSRLVRCTVAEACQYGHAALLAYVYRIQRLAIHCYGRKE